MKKQIDWNTTDPLKAENPEDIFRFRNAVLPSDGQTIGSFYDKIPWNKSYKDLKISFFKLNTEIISQKNILPQIQNSEFEIQYSIAYESGIAFLQFTVFPFRSNPQNGNTERLKDFVLKIEASGEEKVETFSGKKSTNEMSVLKTGNWYKIRTAGAGMYKLSYSDLVSLGLSQPGETRIYGWGGKRLSENSANGTQDVLLPVQTIMVKGEDGIFNQGDYLLFYAEGTVRWEFDYSKSIFTHDKNNYSDYGYYFLTSDMGPAIEAENAEIPPEEPDYQTNSYDFRDFHELEERNFIESGKEWYGEVFDLTIQRDFNFNIPGLVTAENVRLSTSIYSRAKDIASYYIYTNGLLIDTAYIRKTNLSDYTATYAYQSNELYSFKINTENLNVRLRYNKPDPTASGFLDYLSLNARALLNLSNNQLSFRDSRTMNSGGIAEFTIANVSQDTRLWLINDIHAIKNIALDISGSTGKFKYSGEELNEFIAFNIKASFPAPDITDAGLGKISNQDLHQLGHPDLVIITHPLFREEAERLANFRREFNGLEVYVTEPGHIYNDFSSGRPDVTAIRNFMRSLFISAEGNIDLQPRYLLLFGDGSFEFKNADASKGNFVPTYQSDNSLSPISSYVSDDFFGLLDDGEDMVSGLLDIGIGRLPVKNLQEAKLMVNKIINYESVENMGDWRNLICFVGDDEDFNIHSKQADELARYVENNYNSFNINKIFLDAFKQETTSKGERYPSVNKAINQQIEKGALIFNYTGHGGTKGLAHEQILGLNDISTWKNSGKLPLFMTATCEFSRFDEPDIVSGGEEVILNPEGGGIALLTTTRLVYSGPNHVLNERFYEIVFKKDSEGKNYCLGDIMKYSKNNAGYGINKRNFTLLGDPAMRLTYPSKHITTDSINFTTVEQFNDTLKAFNEVTISGHIMDEEGQVLSDFNGIVFPSIFDKSINQTTLANDGGPTMNFTSRKNLLYKGKASVKNGYFRFSFIIPKDINYAVGSGRISYYALDSITDAAGAYDEIIIGGSSSNVTNDFNGPQLKVYMNNNYFMEGGITNENPVLYVEVSDEHGINTTGNGIGHDITAILNEDSQNSFLLNDYYQSELDSYKSGIIEYPFFNLSEGQYSVSVKVWDIYNNSSEGFTEFVVLKNNQLILDQLMNLPNPFYDVTEISFQHNKSNTNLDIIVDIFNMQGGLIKTIKSKQFSSGFRSEPIVWDGNADFGTNERQGMYIYRIRVKSSDGTEAEKSGRMIILR